MNRITLERRIDDKGTLQLVLSLGADAAGRDIRITLEPISPARGMTPEEWQALILATAGGWHGEFERPPQGELEERESLS